jgi:magnesium transporter
MLYFSELRGKTILAGDLFIGTLDDVVFQVSPAAVVTKLFVKKQSGQKFFLPYSAVDRIGGRIHVDANFAPTELEENELFVGKNINDQQIIDINGSNIVRVNDVVFIQQPQLHISGVDIGALGVLRWFGLEDIVSKVSRLTGREIIPKFLAWTDVAPVELARGKVVMKQSDTKLKRLKPEDLAGHLDTMSIRNVKRIINMFEDVYAAEVFSNLSVWSQTSLLRSFLPAKSASIISQLETSEAVDALITLRRSEKDKIINLLERHQQHEIKRLMGLAKTPVGHVVSNQFLTVKPQDTAGTILNKVRAARNDIDDIRYVYVVNNENQLIGIFTLYELIIQKSDVSAYKFMIQNPIVVQLSTPKELVLRRMQKYNLNSVPVVTEKRHMLGIVDLLDILDEQK